MTSRYGHSRRRLRHGAPGLASLLLAPLLLVPFLLAACAPPSVVDPDARVTAALAESPEITLTVTNTHAGGIRFVGPLGNTFDVLQGEGLSLRLVVVALATFEENVFRPWLVPVGPIDNRLVELDEPGLVRLQGLFGELSFLAPGGAIATLRITAEGCRGLGWRAPGLRPTEFSLRSASASEAPLRLCPPDGV